MSPLEIEIMLHYFSGNADYMDGGWEPGCQIENCINMFVAGGYLVPHTDIDRLYEITEGGKVYVHALMEVPLPTQVWQMPEKKDRLVPRT